MEDIGIIAKGRLAITTDRRITSNRRGIEDDDEQEEAKELIRMMMVMMKIYQKLWKDC